MNERITMKHIADQAGVSQATVSLSLANHPRIPASTRTRIQALARKLSYQPNPYVAALMRSRRRGKPMPGRPILAIVCAYDRPDGWRHAPGHTVRETLEGALARATERGYQGQEVWLHKDGMSNERFSEVLQARGIQGILLGPIPSGVVPPALRWDYFSVVRIGLPLHDLPARAVCHDNYYASMMAVEECLKWGYRKPGLILLKSHNAVLQRRWEAGFLSAIQSLPVGRRLAPWACESWPEARALKDWIQARRPDVIITPDHETIGKTLEAIGIDVPAGMGLASLACPVPDGRISGIHQNGRLIGSSAIDTLVELVERNERGLPARATALMIQGHWNCGQTLRDTRIHSALQEAAR